MSPKRVLYIEDNFQNKRLVRKILNAKGYEVLEATDGLTGVEMAFGQKPDLILMDINIPGIDGMEATARIKAAPEVKAIPIIALTANAMRGDRERIMAAGCDEYMQKPINNAKLVETVQRFIGPADSEAPASAASVPLTTPPPTPAVATVNPAPVAEPAPTVVAADPAPVPAVATVNPAPTAESAPNPVPAAVEADPTATPSSVSAVAAVNPPAAPSQAAAANPVPVSAATTDN